MYYNPSEKSWSGQPYMVKDYTVVSGPLLGTVVVVKITKKVVNKKGEEEEKNLFVPMGVRVEDVRSRSKITSPQTGKTYHLPGRSYFLKFKTGLLSESDVPQFVTDRCGQPVMDLGVPKLTKSNDRAAGVPAEQHRLYHILNPVIGMATSRYAEWRAEQRAA